MKSGPMMADCASVTDKQTEIQHHRVHTASGNLRGIGRMISEGLAIELVLPPWHPLEAAT